MSLVMNFYHSSLNPSPSSSSYSTTIPHIHAPKWRILLLHPMTSKVSCSLRRHHRRRRRRGNPEIPNQRKPSSPLDEKLQVVIDIENLSNRTPMSMQRLLSLYQLRFNQFVQSGNSALEDLRSLITVDADRRVVVSCRRTTLEFMGNLVLWSCVIVFALRILVKLGLGFWGRLGFGNTSGLILRRDRSLGGREVMVGRKGNNFSGFGVLESPLSPAEKSMASSSKVRAKNFFQRKEEKKLPSWWPVSLPPPVITADKQEYQKMANRLIRAMMDYRTSGKDISEDDIIQFRRLCRISGARVSIDTTNARDSFYRASVNFVLNVCGSAKHQSTLVHIDGEDARLFVAGLADNIGLENARAGRIVSAVVAARTRSCFLQAWALQMQGRHQESLVELAKICRIHQTFPPEECSPEMEMVARGLEKHLKLEQREVLMNMLTEVCGEGRHRSAAEALGLVPSPEGVYFEQGN